MTALLFTFALFLAFAAVGTAFLAALGADLNSLRIALTAPIVGSAVTVLPLFVLSHAGVAMEDGALPVFGVLGVGSVVALGWRRPRLPLGVLPVVALCIAGLLLVGWPMFEFGFHWIANANADMADYVLSATNLQQHGLLAPLDVGSLSNDRGFGTAMTASQSIGVRPGSNILLAGLASASGTPPYELYMPQILALNLCGICGVGALAMQATRRWWAASVAAGLLVVSPLASYGVVQELLPQVWGLGLACVLLALLMRSELHRGSGPAVRDVVVIGVVAAALVLVYVELASMIVVAYALYVGILCLRREVGVTALLRLWAPAVAFLVVVLNTYLLRELDWVRLQANIGVSGEPETSFAYSLLPSALPAIVGLQRIFAGATARYLGVSIGIAAILLVAVIVASLLSARRGHAAATVLVVYAGVGLLLASRSSSFGLFKLYMYVQPFLAAAVAVWLAGRAKRASLALAAVALALLVLADLRVQQSYVRASRDPIDLRHASSEDLLPAFRRFFASAREPVVSVTENPVIARLEAANVGEKPLYLISRDVTEGLLEVATELQTASLLHAVSRLRALDGWEERSFDLRSPGRRVNVFSDNVHASKLLREGRCDIILPTGSQHPLNRFRLPEGSPDLVMRPCSGARNVLVFTVSALGQSFYLPEAREAVSFYQLEPDYFYPGKTFAGFGRFALFRVVGGADRVRLALNVTTTVRGDGVNRLPPATVVGSSRAPLGVVGRGSARVYSSPLRPQMIGGQPYVMLDMGEDGAVRPGNRSGIANLWSGSLPDDPRFLTSYVRDISLVGEGEYRNLRAPSALRDFPADLDDPGLEYSGIYEDGWVAEESYVVLAGGEAADLVLQADVPARKGQRLEVLVNGRRVVSRSVSAGDLQLRVPVPASAARRRVTLRWAEKMALGPQDRRPAAALLKLLAIEKPS
jgi:hypothetical protein